MLAILRVWPKETAYLYRFREAFRPEARVYFPNGLVQFYKRIQALVHIREATGEIES